MSKKRVHELAKEFGLENREAVLLLQQGGVDVKTHSSSVYEDEARAVLMKAKGKPAPAAAAPSAATPAAAPAASAPKRVGMMIVKKKSDAESAPAAEAPQAPAAPVEEPHAEQAAPVEARSVEREPVAPTEPSREDEPAAEAVTPAARSVDSRPIVTPPPQPPPSRTSYGSQPSRTGGSRPAAYHRDPSQDRPRQSTPEQQDAAAAEQANLPEGGAAPADAAAGDAGAPMAQQRPGAAQVVRMIDRDKLLERIPSRRLGGGQGGPRPGGYGQRPGGPGGPGGPRPGPGGQRFGGVTELRVVTDPFGRGREMVDVNRRGPGPSGPPGARPPMGPRPGGPGGPGGPGQRGKGRGPSKREMVEMRERAMHPARLKKKKTTSRTGKQTVVTQPRASKRVVKMGKTITVAELASALGVKAAELIGKLMNLGMMVSQNQGVDFDTATLLATEYEYTVTSEAFDEKELLDAGNPEEAEDTANLKPRPPVVTVMGHVDHGKTSLLDAIRKAKVADGEAGGITQHIGAYQVPVPGKGLVTFLDTPGHAAFTQMRARGAQITDIVVLVVAADDGVMPQTEEALKHAQAAEVPIIVAVNKIDKPEAQPERVMQELSKFNLLSEAWGGDTIFVNTSATKGTGIPELLEAILLQAEVLELKANPDRPAIGSVVEAQLDKGRGAVATLLIETGTLRQGDAIVVGEYSGRVRAMLDDEGKMIKEAGPSTPVEIIGLDGVPGAGDQLNVVENADAAREVAENRKSSRKEAEQTVERKMSLDDIMKRMAGQSSLELKIVLKADVQGSAEAVKDALTKLATNEVKVSVIYSGVGGISESDITLAAASNGIVLGFGVRPDAKARSIAEREGVEIRTYAIIYEMLDDVRKAMEGLLQPESREKIIGRAEVREIFRVSKIGTIAGSRVVDGKAMRSARIRVLRDNVQVFDGKVASLRSFKNDVREVDQGAECGVSLEGYQDVKPGDVLEFYQVEEVARRLETTPAGGGGGGGGSRRGPTSNENRPQA